MWGRPLTCVSRSMALWRALCLMWSEVRWRPPAIEGERALLTEALQLLGRAFPLDPSLPYPWREWKEMIDNRGFLDAAAEQIGERAAAEPADGPLIGYRRQRLLSEALLATVDLDLPPREFRTEGFWFVVPDALVIPIGSIRRIELRKAPEDRVQRFGFSLPETT